MIYDEKSFKLLLLKYNNVLNDKLKILSNEINELFMNSDSNIKNMLLKKKLKQDIVKLVSLMLFVIFLIIHLLIIANKMLFLVIIMKITKM